MTNPNTLHCPTCTSALSPDLECAPCKITYPSLNNVPWLFPQPQLELARWEARAHKELQDLRARHTASTKALAALKPSAPGATHTRERLNLLATACADQINCLSELLAPLLADHPSSDRTTYEALKAPSLTDSTTLFSYATNLFRDWVWGDEENNQALNMLCSVALGSLGNTLVLGAGGGRLAYDLARGPATAVTALDINPFTTLTAAQITASGGAPASAVDLWEFPLAPVATADAAIKRSLVARPENAAAAEAQTIAPLSFVLADARALPFADQSFDTVVTPWYTDVVQQTPVATARQVNAALKPGGRWLNFGSVAFADTDAVNALLLPELTELVAANGFTTPVVLEERGPYLCSPHSRFGRLELLHAFAAEKSAEAAELAPQGSSTETPEGPVWLADTTHPVPTLESFQEQAMATQVHAYLMSLIDGQRSITDIALVLEQRKLMSAREGVPVVQGFLQKMLKDN